MDDLSHRPRLAGARAPRRWVGRRSGMFVAASLAASICMVNGAAAKATDAHRVIARRAPAAAVAPTQTTVVPLGLNAPQDVAVGPDGSVYATDTGNNRVLRVPPNGGPLSEVTVALTGLDHPTGVGVDSAGDVYALDAGNNRVVELPKGGAQKTLPITGLSLAGISGTEGGLMVDSAGDLWVSDTGHNRVVTLPKGGLQATVGFTGLNHPTGVAADGQGRVYVADTGHNRIVALPSGGTQSTVGFTGLYQPTGVAVLGLGNVYVSDTGNNRVVYRPSGGSQSTTGLHGLIHPGGVKVGSNGVVYVADPGNDRVRYLKGGVDDQVNFLGGLTQATGLAVDAAQDLYIGTTDAIGPEPAGFPAGPTVYSLMAGDHMILGMSGFTGLAPFAQADTSFVGGMPAVDASGDVFVADTFNNRVLELSSADELTTVAFDGLDHPTATAVDASGDVFVADTGNNRVVELPNGGDQVTVDLAGLNMPLGVAVDPAGDLFVADTGNNRVVELPNGGSATAVAFSGLDYPAAVAVNPTGTIFVADRGHNRILALAPGDHQATVPFSGLVRPLGVAADGKGDVYATSAGASGAVVELSGYPTVPGAPTIGPAVGGTESAQVSWTAPVDSGGSPVTGYVVTPYLGSTAKMSTTFDSTATTQTVNGLLAAGGYSFKVAAVNAVGTGPQSAASNGVVPVTAPTAPTIGSVFGANSRVQVSWSPPSSNGGSALTGYVVTAYVGASAQSTRPFASTATTQVITGLSNGVAYTFRVAATNAVGTGPQSASSALAFPPFSTLAAFVQRQSQDFLGRSPTSTELLDEVDDLNHGAPPSGYITALRRSTDATSNVDPTTRLYFSYFLRTPDSGGLNFWIGQKRIGRSLYDISSNFASSGEFQARYGSLSNRAFVSLVYQNVLGRAADSNGLNYWTNVLNAGAASRGQVMVSFSESTESQNKKAPSVDVAVTWIDMLGTSPDTGSFNTWVANLTTGGRTVGDLVRALLADPRYGNRFG